jgi:hypothetical protein
VIEYPANAAVAEFIGTFDIRKANKLSCLRVEILLFCRPLRERAAVCGVQAAPEKGFE